MNLESDRLPDDSLREFVEGYLNGQNLKEYLEEKRQTEEAELSQQDVDAFKKVGKKYLKNLSLALKEEKKDNQPSKKKGRGWADLVVPLVSAAVVTGYEVYKETKGKKER